MKIYIIAGEASGDLHGAALMRALLNLNSNIKFRFWGGDEMTDVAGPPEKHIKDLAFMGFTEVVRHLPTILSNFSAAKKDIMEFNPDALLLIDYPGFNLRMAKWARKKGLRVVYYISPQLWAWNQSRAKQVEQNVDQMLVILPFEKAFYKNKNIDVDYVGHPLAERLSGMTQTPDFLPSNDLDDRPIIALLPGSRKQEILSMLPIMLSAADNEDYQFVIAGAPSLERDFYLPYLTRHENVKLVQGQTYQLLLHSHSALVTSGTATLETGLLRVPQIVCYKGSWLSYQIARRLIKVSYISLVNLILDRALVPELIQDGLNPVSLKENLSAINSGPVRSEIMEGYDELIDLLANQKASETAAELIIEGIG